MIQQSAANRTIAKIGLALCVGLGLGILNIYIQGIPSQWRDAVILGVLAPVVVLLIGDLRKIVLVAFIINMPLGFEVFLQNRAGHQGGPSGYVISLMTLALIVGYAVWLAERPKSNVYTFKSMTGPLVIFILMAMLSVFWALETTFSLVSIFMLIQMFLMYFYIVNHVKTWADFRVILNTWIVCLALEGLLMILQSFTGASISFAGIASQTLRDAAGGLTISRAGGTIGSANGAAIWLTPSLAITMGAYLVYREMKLPETKLALLAFILGVIGLVVTFSRSGWFAFGLATFILGAWALSRGIGRRPFAALVALGLVITVIFSNLIIGRLINDDAGSASSREIGDKMAYSMIEANPFGVGINNFDERKMGYLPRELVGQPRKWVYIVHNHYLLIWAEMGFYGLLAFVLMLLVAAVHGIRLLIQKTSLQASILAASLLAAMAGYALHMTTDVFSWPIHVQLLWTMIALLMSARHLVHTPLPASRSEPKSFMAGQRHLGPPSPVH